MGVTLGVEAVQTQGAVVGVSTDGTNNYPPVTTMEWLAWSAVAGLRLRME
jgi:hypothetical protein